MADLLTVPNFHEETDGGGNVLPEVGPDDFVAYMPNEYGEQMVYVHRRGEETATLYHGDFAWEPVTVREGKPQDFVHHEAEALFVYACWLASSPLYSPSGRRPHGLRPHRRNGSGGRE